MLKQSVWYLSIAMVLCILVLYRSELLSSGWNNAGMVILNNVLSAAPTTKVSQTATMKAELLLRQAVIYNPERRSAWRGLGFVLVTQGREDEGVTAWQVAGGMAEELVRWGQQVQTAERNQDALAWYNRAVKVDPEMSDGRYHLAALSRDLIWEQSDRVEYLSEIYEKYVIWNKDDLVVNGGFESGSLGWSSHRPSDKEAIFRIDDSIFAEGKNSGYIKGTTDQYHGGWYHRLFLKEGARYRFSIDLRLEDVQDLQVEVLYWESYADRRRIGHQGQVVSGDVEWAHFETNMQVPRSDKGTVTFYPVLVTGQGQVWIDNVQIVALDDR